MVYVCTNRRESGERVSCAAAGQWLRDELKKLVKSEGWDDRVRVCASGCMDRCEEGPNAVLLHADGRTEWLSRLAETDLAPLLESLRPAAPADPTDA